jgi:hypothetical protein
VIRTCIGTHLFFPNIHWALLITSHVISAVGTTTILLPHFSCAAASRVSSMFSYSLHHFRLLHS